ARLLRADLPVEPELPGHGARFLRGADHGEPHARLGGLLHPCRAAGHRGALKSENRGCVVHPRFAPIDCVQPASPRAALMITAPASLQADRLAAEHDVDPAPAEAAAARGADAD